MNFYITLTYFRYIKCSRQSIIKKNLSSDVKKIKQEKEKLRLLKY